MSHLEAAAIEYTSINGEPPVGHAVHRVPRSVSAHIQTDILMTYRRGERSLADTRAEVSVATRGMLCMSLLCHAILCQAVVTLDSSVIIQLIQAGEEITLLAVLLAIRLRQFGVAQFLLASSEQHRTWVQDRFELLIVWFMWHVMDKVHPYHVLRNDALSAHVNDRINSMRLLCHALGVRVRVERPLVALLNHMWAEHRIGGSWLTDPYVAFERVIEAGADVAGAVSSRSTFGRQLVHLHNGHSAGDARVREVFMRRGYFITGKKDLPPTVKDHPVMRARSALVEAASEWLTPDAVADLGRCLVFEWTARSATSGSGRAKRRRT